MWKVVSRMMYRTSVKIGRIIILVSHPYHITFSKTLQTPSHQQWVIITVSSTPCHQHCHQFSHQHRVFNTGINNMSSTPSHQHNVINTESSTLCHQQSSTPSHQHYVINSHQHWHQQSWRQSSPPCHQHRVINIIINIIINSHHHSAINTVIKTISSTQSSIPWHQNNHQQRVANLDDLVHHFIRKWYITFNCFLFSLFICRCSLYLNFLACLFVYRYVVCLRVFVYLTGYWHSVWFSFCLGLSLYTYIFHRLFTLVDLSVDILCDWISLLVHLSIDILDAWVFSLLMCLWMCINPSVISTLTYRKKKKKCTQISDIGSGNRSPKFPQHFFSWSDNVGNRDPEEEN